MKQVEVSVVIPAYNEEKLLERCLKSLIAQTYPRERYEIIVVDNASTDTTFQIAKRYADCVVKEPQKGLMYARKSGFNKANGDIILRTDADTFLPSDWIEHAVTIFEEQKDIDVITGNFVHVDDNNNLHNTLSDFQSKTKELGFDFLNKVFSLTGSCSGFRKAFYYSIGGFDEELDPVIADQIEIAERSNKYGTVYYDSTWNSFSSNRRDKIKNQRSFFRWLNDIILYRVVNIMLFLIFKKQVGKKIGRGWSDIRS